MTNVEVLVETKLRLETVSVSPSRVEYRLQNFEDETEHLIWYEFDYPIVAEDDLLMDGILCGVIFYCMRFGGPLQVRGAISRTLLRNIYEYQRAWLRWRRGTYHFVAIECDEVVDPLPLARERAITAFSGGVDGYFNVLHNQSVPKELQFPLEAALLVHGFDIPLDEQGAFEIVERRYRQALNDFGLTLSVARTNIKALKLQSWEDSFGAQLVSCLHHYSAKYSIALFGSGEPYDTLVIPWGSSPIVDHLLSDARQQIVHYGAAYSRTEKVALIAQCPSVRENLRVCWQGTDKSANCGVCEKCARTRFNFAAVGYDDVPCLGTSDLEVLAHTIRFRNDVMVAECQSILAYCQREGKNLVFERALRRKIMQYRIKKKLGMKV